jgi:hypothetical protein
MNFERDESNWPLSTPEEINADLKKLGAVLSAGHQITVVDLDGLPGCGEVYSELISLPRTGEIITADDLYIRAGGYHHTWNAENQCVDVVSYAEYCEERLKRRSNLIAEESNIVAIQIKRLGEMLTAGETITVNDVIFCIPEIHKPLKEMLVAGETITADDLVIRWSGDGRYRIWNAEKECVDVKTDEEYFRENFSSGQEKLKVSSDWDTIKSKHQRYFKAAEVMGIDVPERLLLEHGEIFWCIGWASESSKKSIEEVRLSGVIIPDTVEGRAPLTGDLRNKAWRDSLSKWSTEVSPKFRIGRGGLKCNATDTGRNWEALAATGNFSSYLYAWELFQGDDASAAPSEDESSSGLLLSGQITADSAPIEPIEPPSTSSNFAVHTGQEWQALQQVAGNGKGFDSHLFRVNEQRGALRHKQDGNPFCTELLLTDEERAAGYGVELLCDATRALGIDDGLIWFYVSQQLAPVGTLPKNTAATTWIDLDDVARRALGGYANNPKEREERRAQVYHAIKYGARAFVSGTRSTPYRDKQRQEISTKIYTSPWQISGFEQSEGPGLWPESNVPLRVRLVASPEWTALTTSRDTGQWLPGGEKIGAISGNKPGGSWARALAISYLTWCRIDVRAALDGQTPTRRALLDTITPKKTPYTELLGTSHAARIREYWATAESHLSDAGIIEPVRHRERISKGGSSEWQTIWLNAPAPWLPGPEIRAALEAIAAGKYIEKPRQLNPAKRRGRPAKSGQSS